MIQKSFKNSEFQTRLPGQYTTSRHFCGWKLLEINSYFSHGTLDLPRLDPRTLATVFSRAVLWIKMISYWEFDSAAQGKRLKAGRRHFRVSHLFSRRLFHDFHPVISRNPLQESPA
jgi:hypothetical protein